MLLWPWTVALAVALAVPLELLRPRRPGRPGTPAPSGSQADLARGIPVTALPLAYLTLIGTLVGGLPLAAGLLLFGLLVAYLRRRRDHAA